MESIDISVLRELNSWRAAGRHALLATVVRTWGASPRPPGSMLALREDGRIQGSVSGGCIEDDLILRFANPELQAATPQLVRYGVNADEAHRFGLPCGGTLELLLEFDPSVTHLSALLHMLDEGMLVRRTVQCADGTVELARADVPAELMFDGRQLVSTLGPGYRMLLIGAGAMAEYLATMALFSGFEVTVCDPRVEYSAAWKVAGVKLTSAMPDDAVLAFQANRRSCIVALSHDPKLDDLALLEALNSPAFYIGAIGSRRNSANRRERLMTHFDASAESLARLHGPIGVYIGSKTPPEIAVSIMAEILAAKNGVNVPVSMQTGEAKSLLLPESVCAVGAAGPERSIGAI